MAEDVTTTDIQTAKQADADRKINPPTTAIDPPASDPMPGPGAIFYQDDPKPAAERLRAFEDEHFGAEAVRINDRIERGSGSPFADAAPEVREQHARIEKLIATEQKLSDAHAALIAADAEHEAALQAVEKTDAPGE